MDRVAGEVFAKAGTKVHYMVGTMIEIPRAALTADRVAKEAEFFSFGTNDLTQTTMGLSRDDYTKFQKDYEKAKIFKADPVRRARSGRRRQAGRDGRESSAARARKNLEVGICGEHGGEPVLGAVLLPRRNGLRILLALSRADRPTRRRAGRHLRRQSGSNAHRLRTCGAGESCRRPSLTSDQRFSPAAAIFPSRDRKGASFLI